MKQVLSLAAPAPKRVTAITALATLCDSKQAAGNAKHCHDPEHGPTARHSLLAAAGRTLQVLPGSTQDGVQCEGNRVQALPPQL